jgi:DNA repair exonuclease SbcCD nuclease subunit
MVLHPFNRRLLAEDLVRTRRPDERERYAASQRQARIDPNPHQIDAVIFALRRLPEGGCILADEVGLGKTIEAGLVIAQRRAEGAQRILLIVPKALVGQWQSELFQLFGIQVREDQTSFLGPGVYVVGREFAGSERGAAPLGAVPPFDLVVIDEAHEVFSGLHKRYGREDGGYDESSEQAVMAHRVRGFLRAAPVLLLTATPMQNSLAELWGLVQYVERTGTLLGDITTFRKVFCAEDDRMLVPGQEHELQRRLALVLRRTLRRQAQEFLDRPFTQRRCRLYEYAMSADERALYDDVTEYLLRPSLFAFAGRQRKLLLIGFHRRMASSIPALAASLENVVARLRRLAAGQAADDLAAAMLGDLEAEDEAAELTEEGQPPSLDPPGVLAELAHVEGLLARANDLPSDAKARSFQEAIRLILALGRDGQGSGRAVVFTESIKTQEYLRDLLLRMGLADEDVTLFRGQNDHARALQALARWQQEEGDRLAPEARPSREVAVRLALVHEFSTRSKVLVCTEAGAKGLNLQFCETVINYDLPWNPQRIEQRIGRCHRYSQQRDVTVVNFINRDNEGQQLTFDILSRKLDLFGKVLDASDTVLHEPRTDAPEITVSALAVELEGDLRTIYSRSRTVEEITRELADLRDRMAERRNAYEKEYERTSQIIKSRFDDEVQRVFRRLRDELPAALTQLDQDIAEVVDGYLAACGIEYRRSAEGRRVHFEIVAEQRLAGRAGLEAGRRFATGDARGLGDAEGLNLAHPLVKAAIADAQTWPGGSLALRLPPDAPAELAGLAGTCGVLAVVRVDYGGFEPVQRVIAAAVADGKPLAPALAAQLARLPAVDGPPAAVAVDPPWLDDAVDEAVFADQREVEKSEQKHFEQALGQLERFVEDKVLVCRRERAGLAEKLRAARTRRDEIVGASVRERIEAEMARLAGRDEELEQKIDALDSRADRDYRKWMERSLPPTAVPGAEGDPAVPGGLPDRSGGADDVMLRVLHTADWHLGKRFLSFPEEAQKKLSRARMDVVGRILDLARRQRVDAVLCAGDLFDDPSPAPDFWEGLAQIFHEHAPAAPIFLVPGNHDPLTADSVWSAGHPFRSRLPAWVHVVDRDDFVYEITPEAVLYARPCRSKAGECDLAMALPTREPGDGRIRIGCVHGSTFDIDGHQTNFPIRRDAGALRGFDYLAIGDTHSFRDVTANLPVPTVYPGAPEATSFDEPGAGKVAVVALFRHGSRPRVEDAPVAYWRWLDRRCRDMFELRALLTTPDLERHVVRLRLDMTVSLAEESELERIVRALQGTAATHGRAGVLVVDREKLRIEAGSVDDFPDDLPPVLKDTVARLDRLAAGALDEADKEKATRALAHLYKLWQRRDELGGAR